MKITSGSITAVLALTILVAASRAQEVTTSAQTGSSPGASTAELSQTSSPPKGASEVRIVRLSQVKGEVQLDRKTERGFEQAFANLPITQGERLQTREGVAEVEFEDNSTLRIAPNTAVEFPALQRTPSGATTTSVKLLKGTLYVSLANTKGNEFTVALGNDTIALTPSSHIRIDVDAVDASKSKLAVFNGSAQVADSSGTTTVGKKKALSFDANAQTSPVVTSNVEPGPFDEWDKKAMDYHNLRSMPAAYGGSSYLYGINDLNYYGSFVNVGGCGSMWRPYFASAGWDPYANGVWALYPGSGYSWVSPYPWGWTPFHSGSWEYCSTGGGWGWRPGGSWNGLRNQPATSAPLLHQAHGTAYPQPPHAPVAGSSTLVVVSTRPLAVSKLSSSDTFVLRNDSAGMGVPRESFGKLNKLSAGVAQHGSVSTPVILQSSPGEPGRGFNNTHANDPSAASRSAAANHRSNNAPTYDRDRDRQRTDNSAAGSSRSSSPSPSAPSSAGSSSAGAGAGSLGAGSSRSSSPSPSSGAGTNNHR